MLDGVRIPVGVPEPPVTLRRLRGESSALPEATGIRLTGDVSREFTVELWREPSLELCRESFFSLLNRTIIF